MKIIYVKTHTICFNIPVSIGLTTLAHMLNGHAICLNTSNYPIFNMQYFRYCHAPLFWYVLAAGMPTVYWTSP